MACEENVKTGFLASSIAYFFLGLTFDMAQSSQGQSIYAQGKKGGCEEGEFYKKYKKAFGYGDDYEASGGTHLIDGANFDGEYDVYFDCYKKGKKTRLRMWMDKNGDGEYSGEGEFIAYSGYLNKTCAKYCKDFEKGYLKVSYDVVKDYAKGKKEKKSYARAYKDGDDCYGYKKVKAYDEYGDKYYKKKYYKCGIDYVKLELKAYYYKEVCDEYDDGYGGYDYKCEDEKKSCKATFKIDKYDYLNNYETAIDFCG